MGAYRLYRLARLNDTTFDVKTKFLDRDLHIIPNKYAENINNFSSVNGVLYVKDEKATKLWEEKKPFKTTKEYIEFEEVKPIEEIEVKEKIVVKADKGIIDASVDELRQIYEDLSGKKAHHLWGVKKLSDEINLLDNK